MSKLLYVGQQVADDLKNKITDNLDRYREGNFGDIENKGDWRIPLSVDADLASLVRLELIDGATAEIQNSLIVGHALDKLTPTLARENRIWVRLSHVECLEYARKRWLQPAMNDDALTKAVTKHFFAPTLTGCRDDHAIARLWWNHHIAKLIMPDNPARALKMILARADIRLNFLERPGLAARPSLAKGIVLIMENNADLLSGEHLFRQFMKQLNLLGAGVAFEVLSEDRIDQFMGRCLKHAQGTDKSAAV
ncbi:DUF6339 family protein [Rhodanobacter soli]|uniref:DUF6339 family protein n=1 Tax=Rhodanobacter soli TaxID=590609 RepID=UPI0031D74410